MPLPSVSLQPGELLSHDGTQILSSGKKLSFLEASYLAAEAGYLPSLMPSLLSSLGLTTIASGLATSGTTQGTGTPVTAAYNVFTSVATSGAATWAATGVLAANVVNLGSGVMALFPMASGQINSLGANASLLVASGTAVTVLSVSATQLYAWAG